MYTVLFDISVCTFIDTHTCTLFSDPRFMTDFFFNYIKYKRKKSHFYRPQASDPGEKRNETKLPWWKNKSFLIILGQALSHLKKWFTLWEKKKTSKLLSGENSIWKLEFGETDTQRYFESLYMTCLDVKKLQGNFKVYIEFPTLLLISHLFSLVKYIFSNILWRLLYILVAKCDFVATNCQWVLM